MAEPVVLLHGIWMRRFTLALLAHRLRAAGYQTHCLDYASVLRRSDDCLARIESYVAALPPGPVHLVGHSLGGLMALNVAARAAPGRIGRVVCLGTPLHGSATARALARWRGLRWSLGGARNVLCEGVPRWPEATPVGVVAGRIPLGVGVLVRQVERPHDGVVAVPETRNDRLADHAVVGTSHMGLLLSRRVAGMTARFLADSRFK